jgi:hypothetical protein
MNERQMVKTHLEALAVRVRGKGGTGPWTTSRARRLVIITGPRHGASPDPGRRYSMDERAEAAADVLPPSVSMNPWTGSATPGVGTSA